MESRERRVDRSIQRRLSIWLSLVVVFVGAVAGVYSYLTTFNYALHQQDDQLGVIAALVERQHPLPGVSSLDNVPVSDPESRFIVLHLPSVRASEQAADGFHFGMRPGIQTASADGEEWRFYLTYRESSGWIAVGQSTEVRDEIAQNSAVQTLFPLLALVPLLLLALGILVRGAFKPLHRLARELDRRTDEDLTAISQEHLPDEIRPFVTAINRLFTRVARSVAMQRRFVADAAHELRSPITALSLQAERLESAEMSDEARTRVASLREGILRAHGLLEQMLALARAQEPAPKALPVRVRDIFRQVLEDISPVADSRGIDLGVVGGEDLETEISELDLRTVVRNLVDNAVRYTPTGGRVDLSMRLNPRGWTLEVQDTGPGIPMEERSLVFDPFHRILGTDVPGSGLGLSIVRAIAERVDAVVELEWADVLAETGLRVRVRFPEGRQS